MPNLQQYLPEELTVQQVARILDMSVFAVRRCIESDDIESESMDILPTASVGNYLMLAKGWSQEGAEQHIYNQIFE